MSVTGSTRSASDDALTFDQIYRAHLGFVWRTLRSMGVPESAVEDATHEVFVVLHRRWGDWDGRAKVTTWLYGIARGVARNTRRQRGRADRKLRAVHAQPPQDSDRFSRPDRHLDRADAARLLGEFLETLDPPKREAFRLCAIEGLSAKEAGACVGEKANTMSTRLRRARLAFDTFVRELQEASA
ncbi:MAG: sigma-70 family RNA polymerase sigma factor [Myxococcota bacterium]